MGDINKRKENRVNDNIPIPINKILLNNMEINSKNKTFPATIINISTNGVLLQSPLSVPVNLKFIFELLDEKSKILCFLEIIRKENCGGAFKYGCKLKTIFQSDRERLRIFVLKKQVQNMECLSGYREDDQVEHII